MVLMWYHHGTTTVSKDFFYRFAAVVDGKICLIGINRNEKKAALSKLDFETLKMTELMSLDYRWISLLLQTDYHAYCEHLINLGPKLSETDGKLLKINTITSQIEIIPLNCEFNLSKIFCKCVVKDHYYIVFHDDDKSNLLVLAVNLKTFEKKLIKIPSSLTISNFMWINVVVNETNIYCFDVRHWIIFVFNTVNNKWRKIKISAPIFDGNNFVNVNGECVVFKTTEWALIFNFQTLKWRKGHFSICPKYYRMVFTKYFELNGKIVTIQTNESKRYGTCFHPRSRVLLDSDKLEIYILDLNLLLKTLCAARIIELNLDQSKLPKKMQDELKRYIQ
ncbi:hypothetical protein CHUAL_010719 [Chamberlinius hualienensis]